MAINKAGSSKVISKPVTSRTVSREINRDNKTVSNKGNKEISAAVNRGNRHADSRTDNNPGSRHRADRAADNRVVNSKADNPRTVAQSKKECRRTHRAAVAHRVQVIVKPAAKSLSVCAIWKSYERTCAAIMT